MLCMDMAQNRKNKTLYLEINDFHRLLSQAIVLSWKIETRSLGVSYSLVFLPENVDPWKCFRNIRSGREKKSDIL